MADAQAGRAILELGTRENRSTSQARLSWMIPACHHSQIPIPSHQPLMRGDREENTRRRKKKAPLQLGPLARSWALAGWLAGLVRWPGQSKAASCKSQRCKLQLGPGHCGPDPSTLPRFPTLPCSPPPPPPSTLLARPRRLTDSAADRPGPFHLTAGLLRAAAAGCCCWGLYSTRSQSHRGRRSRTVSLAWSGMASHAQNWAPISPTLPILHVLRPCSPLFAALLCSALSYPAPSLPVHTGLIVVSSSGPAWPPVCRPRAHS